MSNLFLEALIISLCYLLTNVNCAMYNLLIDRTIFTTNDPILLVTSTPDGRIIYQQTDGDIFEANKTKNYKINDIKFYSIRFYSNTRAIFINQNRQIIYQYQFDFNAGTIKQLLKISISTSQTIVYVNRHGDDLIVCTNIKYYKVYYSYFYNKYIWVQIFNQNKSIINSFFTFNSYIRIYVIDNKIIKKYVDGNLFTTQLHKNGDNIIFFKIIDDSIFFQDSKQKIKIFNMSANKFVAVDKSIIINQNLIQILDGGDCLIFVYPTKIQQVLFEATKKVYYPILTRKVDLSLYIGLIPIYTSTPLRFAYVPNSRQAYPISQCGVVEIWIEARCQTDICVVQNCLQCTLTNLECSLCNSSYVLTDPVTCKFSPIVVDTPPEYHPISQVQVPIIFQQQKVCRITQILNPSTNQCEQNYRFQIFNNILEAQNNINNFPSARTTLKILAPLFIFFDDYWLYIYHLQPQNRPLYLFFYEIFVLGNDKLLPSFIPQDQTAPISSMFQQHSQRNYNYTPKQIYLLQEQGLFFLKKASEMIQWNFQIAFYMYIGFKIVHKIFVYLRSKLSKKNVLRVFLSLFVDYFYENSLFLMFIVGCIQSNLIYICFYGTIQLKKLMFIESIDTINAIVTIFFIFLAFAYALFFNINLYRFQKKNLQIFLDQKTPNINSVILHSVIVGIKNVLQGIFHGIFLGNVLYLMPFLILTKSIMIIFLFRYKKCYQNKFFCWFNIIYFGLGIFMDIYIIQHYFIQPNTFFGQLSDQIHYYIQLSIPLSFIGIILFKILFSTFLWLKQSIVDPIIKLKNNRVAQSRNNKRENNKKSSRNFKLTLIDCNTSIQKHNNSVLKDYINIRNSKLIKQKQHICENQQPEILETQKNKRHSNFGTNNIKINRNSRNLHSNIFGMKNAQNTKDNLEKQMKRYSNLISNNIKINKVSKNMYQNLIDGHKGDQQFLFQQKNKKKSNLAQIKEINNRISKKIDPDFYQQNMKNSQEQNQNHSTLIYRNLRISRISKNINFEEIKQIFNNKKAIKNSRFSKKFQQNNNIKNSPQKRFSANIKKNQKIIKREGHNSKQNSLLLHQIAEQNKQQDDKIEQFLPFVMQNKLYLKNQVKRRMDKNNNQDKQKSYREEDSQNEKPMSKSNISIKSKQIKQTNQFK